MTHPSKPKQQSSHGHFPKFPTGDDPKAQQRGRPRKPAASHERPRAQTKRIGGNQGSGPREYTARAAAPHNSRAEESVPHKASPDLLTVVKSLADREPSSGRIPPGQKSHCRPPGRTRPGFSCAQHQPYQARRGFPGRWRSGSRTLRIRSIPWSTELVTVDREKEHHRRRAQHQQVPGHLTLPSPNTSRITGEARANIATAQGMAISILNFMVI